MKAGYFIAGTDTGVGKTQVAALIVRTLRAKGVDAAGFKPICCGDREDAERLAAAADGRLSLNAVNPVWMRPPVAPYVAAMMEGRSVDVDLVRDAYRQARTQVQTLIVEGAGGWLVPVARDFSMADLAVEFGLPVIVIAANKLGTINHTLLTVRAVQQAGLECAGVILNEVQPPAEGDPAAVTNAGVLEELLGGLGVPLWGEVGYGVAELPGKVAGRL